MKCKKCGETIKKGNLFCSNCGAEVQIVPVYNAIEEELLVDFADETKEAGYEDEKYDEAHLQLLSGKKILAGILAALTGFCIMLVVPMVLQAKNEADTAVSQENPYPGVLDALSEQHTDHAIQLLKAAQKQNEKDLNIRFWLAHLYLQNDQKELQIQTLQEILKLDKENIYACKLLLKSYADDKKFEELYHLYDAYQDSGLTPLFREYMVAAPVVGEMPEQIRQGDTLTITAEEGLNIYYTLDGSSPINNGTIYYAPITLDAGDYEFLIAACNEQGYFSPVVTYRCSVAPVYKLEMPRVTPDSGEYSTPHTIYVNVPSGYQAYYTWNGKTPDASSYKYKGGIQMKEGNNVLSVIYIDEYGNTSSVQRVNYIYMPQ